VLRDDRRFRWLLGVRVRPDKGAREGQAFSLGTRHFEVQNLKAFEADPSLRFGMTCIFVGLLGVWGLGVTEAWTSGES
jgi:hypothetical protein